MTAIYNEIEPFAVRWLRNLITAGHVAPGVVNDRSIADLRPADVAGLGQRHFFAGIAGWSLALRLAGVPDDADVWTGSCPCQSLSDAGKRLGFADPRHLWPEWFRLIRECRPAVVFGEQVASGLGWAWLDLVFADLEGAGYTCAAANLPACSVGAPHRRYRLLFVAYADRESGRLLAARRQPGRADAQAERSCEAGVLADAAGERWHGVPRDDGSRREQPEPTRSSSALCDCGHSSESHHGGDEECIDCSCTYFLLADSEGSGRSEGRQEASQERPGSSDHGPDGGMADAEATGRGARRIDSSHGRPTIEPVRHGNDSWTPCDWIPCRDPNGGPPVFRPIEPGTHPLDHGVPGRVGLLRGYGNAIVPEKVAAFIVAALEAA